MDLGRLMDGVLRGNLPDEVKRMAGGAGGGIAGGAAAGSLMTLLLCNKKGRKMGGKVLKYGGMALLAGLAYKAWSNYREQKPPQHETLRDVPSVPASASAFALDQRSGEGGDFRVALIRAMIAAAKSDGHIDPDEHRRIRDTIEAQGLEAEAKSLILDAFGSEPDPVAIARLAASEEQAAELYVASRMAIDPDVEAERRYLDRLAGALSLPQALVDHLDMTVEDARQQLATPEA